MFRVNQKVVCVNDGPSRFDGKPALVVKDHIYTITKVWMHPVGVPAVLLAEIRTNEEAGFDAIRFRPLVERKTSIEIFTKMLTGNRENINA